MRPEHLDLDLATWLRKRRIWETWELGFDGTWHEISAADVVTKARVMTEQEYSRSFGYVPPLPVVAFGGDGTSGWNSPLV